MSAAQWGAEGLGHATRAGGRASREKLGKALGLDHAPAGFRVRAVAWVGDRIEIAVVDGRDQDYIFAIAARRGSEVGFCATERLVVRFRGRDLPQELQRLVPAAVAARLGKIDLGRLASVLLSDPDFGREDEPLPSREARSEPARAASAPSSPALLVRTPAEAAEDAEALAKLAGSRRSGGPTTLAWLAPILGLDDAPEPWRLRSVAWLEDHLEFSTGDEDDREITFMLEKPKGAPKGIIATPELQLQYKAKDLPDFLTQRFLGVARKRMALLTLGTFGKRLLEDPDLGKAGNATPPEEHARPTNQLDSWATGEAFADFFAGGEMARGQLDSVNLQKFSRNVQHCDNECMFVNPHGPAPLVSMVDYPWERRGRSNAWLEPVAPATGEEETDDNDSMIGTDISEQDVIMGNPGKLRAALELAIGRPNPQKRPIFVANTCVPTVIGEDVESVVREMRRRTDVPVMYLTVTPKSMNMVLVDLLVTRRRAAEAAAGPPEADLVNLIGFPSTDPAVREVEALLGEVGVRVNTYLLPDVEFNRVEALPRAALSVFLPNALWNHMFEQILDQTRTPHLAPQAPYGIDGTRAWVDAVRTQLGLGKVDGARWDGLVAPHAERLASLRERTREHRLALVVRGDELFHLSDPSQTWGIPVLAMLAELGFGIDVLVQARGDKRAAKLADELRLTLPTASGATIETFTDFGGMRDLLAASKASAVLSHHFYDWRVSQAGKNRFALQHLEMGVVGAARAAERLLAICETPLFRRYGRYFARTEAGLRIHQPEAV